MPVPLDPHEAFADALANFDYPAECVNLGSPEGPLDESALLLYPNGENKWVAVLKFGEEGADAIVVFTVERATRA